MADKDYKAFIAGGEAREPQVIPTTLLNNSIRKNVDDLLQPCTVYQ